MKKKNGVIVRVILFLVMIALFAGALMIACQGEPQENPGEESSSQTNSDIESSSSSAESSLTESSATESSTTESSVDQSGEESSEPSDESSADQPESSQEESEEPSTPVTADDLEGIAKTAAEQVGIPFASGGDTPETGFDNSGLIYYACVQNGVQIPRRTSEQAEYGSEVFYTDLQPGDLVFFGESGQAAFGGVYIGNGKMIYSSVPGEDVQEVDITSNYWQTNFATGRRVG